MTNKPDILHPVITPYQARKREEIEAIQLTEEEIKTALHGAKHAKFNRNRREEKKIKNNLEMCNNIQDKSYI